MNVGPTEIIVIVLLALFLFGAGRIADIGKGLGQGIKNFKQGIREADEDDPKKLSAKIETGTPVLEKKEDPATKTV